MQQSGEEFLNALFKLEARDGVVQPHDYDKHHTIGDHSIFEQEFEPSQIFWQDRQEKRTDQCTGEIAQSANNDDTDTVEAQIRVESSRFNIGHQVRIQTSGNTGNDGRDREDDDLVREKLDAHRLGSDRVISHGLQVSSKFGFDQPFEEYISQDDKDQRKIEELDLRLETISE